MIKLLNINLSPRIIGLDLMRSIAIALVVFGHYTHFFYDHLHIVIPATTLSVNRVLSYFVNGFDGVDLFFVLSGFLIGHSLLAAHSQNKLNFSYLVHNFWIKRWLRTLPNYLVALSISILLWFAIPSVYSGGQGHIGFYKYFIFIQNFFRGELLFFPESWSLSVEEWFYLIFPLVLTLSSYLYKNTNAHKMMLLITILLYITVGLLFRIHYSATHELRTINLWNKDIRTVVLMRLDAIIYGVLMAFIKIYYPVFFKKSRFVLLICGMLTLLIAFKFAFLNTNENQAIVFIHGYYFLFVGIGMAMLLPFFYHLRLSNSSLINSVVFISVISYSIYLTNYFIVQRTIETIISENSLVFCIIKFVSALLFTFILSTILYKFVETPFMNLRKKILHE